MWRGITTATDWGFLVWKFFNVIIFTHFVNRFREGIPLQLAKVNTVPSSFTLYFSGRGDRYKGGGERYVGRNLCAWKVSSIFLFHYRSKHVVSSTLITVNAYYEILDCFHSDRFHLASHIRIRGLGQHLPCQWRTYWTCYRSNMFCKI